MNDDPGWDHLDTVYTEASEWIRMCNHIIWAMGTILVPLSLACIPLALEKAKFRWFLAPASVFLFLFWVYVSRLYRASAAITRMVLIDIEREWQLKDELATFRKHGQVGTSRYGLHNTQIACFVILITLWIVLLIWLRNN
jgi:hypothetical protein